MMTPAISAPFRVTKRILAIILLCAGVTGSCFAASGTEATIDGLLSKSIEYLKSTPSKSVETIAQLRELEPQFNEVQREKYYVIQASSLEFRGKHKEQIELAKSVIGRAKDVDVRARLLHFLSTGYVQVGDYENALKSMNDGISLLPKLKSENAKVMTLQSAVTLYNSLHAYDEALGYAERLYTLVAQDHYSVPRCLGIADIVEISFLRGDSKRARSLLAKAAQLCNANGDEVITRSIKSLSAVDLIDAGNVEQGLHDGLELLSEYSKSNESSDYITYLEEAVARAYLKSKDYAQAENHGLKAYNRATSSNTLQLMEKSSVTMSAIKRAMGQLGSALEYFDISMTFKAKMLDEQLQKSLAYQRVKFETQDKVNQLNLLSQKNTILIVEQQLQQKNTENLLLLIVLGLIFLAVMVVFLVRTMQQKNAFRVSSQIDGLTLVSNRAHFVECATQQFKDFSRSLHVVLLDMDNFKSINDTFNHAAGDWVLKAVSNTVTSHLRKTDLFGRLGGEEFAICLPESTEHEALALAERCRAAITAIDTSDSGYDFKISASFGVATRGNHGLFTFEETLAAADKALYVSKNEGRNRVSVYKLTFDDERRTKPQDREDLAA